jgi:hypothetical protein
MPARLTIGFRAIAATAKAIWELVTPNPAFSAGKGFHDDIVAVIGSGEIPVIVNLVGADPIEF